jgi:hypothetical protein
MTGKEGKEPAPTGTRIRPVVYMGAIKESLPAHERRTREWSRLCSWHSGTPHASRKVGLLQKVLKQWFHIYPLNPVTPPTSDP